MQFSILAHFEGNLSRMFTRFADAAFGASRGGGHLTSVIQKRQLLPASVAVRRRIVVLKIPRASARHGRRRRTLIFEDGPHGDSLTG